MLGRTNQSTNQQINNFGWRCQDFTTSYYVADWVFLNQQLTYNFFYIYIALNNFLDPVAELLLISTLERDLNFFPAPFF